MPKTRVIVATTDPQTGQPLAAGAEVELDDEAYQSLRQAGAVEASEDEQKANATPEAQGNYSARTGREQAGGTKEPPRQPPSPEPPESKKKN
jgi:hypothetical protein